jgi:two-component system sensor histidine kinase KdpD
VSQIDSYRSTMASGKHSDDTAITAPAATLDFQSGGPLSARRLLSVLAHDIRGPLTAIAVSSELLVDEVDDLDRGRIREMVTAIYSRTLWLQGLVENLLIAATIDEGHFKIQPQWVNIADILSELKVVVEPLLSARAQSLTIRRGIVPFDIWADGRRLSQALMNLILNASKYSPASTTVDVSLRLRDQHLRISIADRGPGLPHGTQERLFMPFLRAEEAISSGKEGQGLGLAIVKLIVDNHGGRVGAANRRHGGANFWIELPLQSVGR